MELDSGWVDVRSGNTTVPAYTARPQRAGRPLPAVIVIQEVWGVDEHIRDLVHRFAAAGYLATAPDLYAHGGTRPSVLAADRVRTAKAHLDAAPPSAWTDPAAREAAFADLGAAERRDALETVGALLPRERPIDQYVADLRAVVAHLRAHPGCSGRVGSTGYCLGGMLSALLAAREPTLAAGVIYYGTSPALDAMQALACPLAGFYGGDDHRISDGVPAFGEALGALGKSFEYHIYPGAPHAFFNDTRPSYRVDAARDAWARTLMFLDRRLGSAGD